MFIVTRQTGMTPAIAVYLSLTAFASVRLTSAATSTVAFHESLSTTQRLSLNGGSRGNFLICGNICYRQTCECITQTNFWNTSHSKLLHEQRYDTYRCRHD